jgi:ribosomal-protein-alanine N-acetyltransferase
MSIEIRRSTTEDAESMLRFLVSLQSESLYVLPRRDVIPTLADEKKWLANHDGHSSVVFVAAFGDQVVGITDVTRLKPKELSGNCEFGLSVHREYRRKGIAKKLITAVEVWARGEGLRRIELQVFGNNIGAMALYQMLGYVEDGRRVAAVELQDGSLVDLVHMSKVLHDKSLEHTPLRGAAQL